MFATTAVKAKIDNNVKHHTISCVSEHSDFEIFEKEKQLSPLHLLAINGNKQLLQDHLSSGKWNINEVDHMGRTPLIYSVLGDQVGCVLLLLKEGANIDDTDIDERTALHWAAYQGNHKLVKILLSKGANRISRDKEGKTPLHFSTSHDNIKVMQCLIKSMKNEEIDVADYKKMTALCWSVFYGRIDYVRLLLRHGASVISFDKEQRTVLHWCSENKDASILNILLEEDSTALNWQDLESRSALHMYVGQSSYCLVENLLTKKGIEVNIRDKFGRTPLHWAAVLGNTKIVSLLLDNGADYNIGDNNGVRPLQYAAQNNFYETVKIMLDKKDVKDTPDNEKGTALMWAAVKGCDKVLDILLSTQVSLVNAIDIHKQSALHMSTQAGHLSCVKLLIKYGADVNLPDGKQHIPLFYACASGNTAIVNELLKHCSPRTLEECDLEGRCPLHYAAMVDRTDIIKILMQSQPNPNIKDNAGCPPLHFAAYGGFVHCMSVLLENGANVNNQDNEGRTALHWACKSGSLEAVKLLVSRFNAKVNVLEFNGGQLSALDYAYLEDHQDVAFYLTENNAYTGAFLKDFSATKIQAVWKGYKIRKLIDNYFNPHKNFNNMGLNKHKASHVNNQILKRDLKDRKIYPHTLEDSKLHFKSGLYNTKESMFENRKRSPSNISVQSVSPKSSLFGFPNDKFLKPDNLQGPKFSISDDNPLSLRRSNPGSVVSVNLSYDNSKTFYDETTRGSNDYWSSIRQSPDSRSANNGYSDLTDNGILQESRIPKLCLQSFELDEMQINKDLNQVITKQHLPANSIKNSKKGIFSDSNVTFQKSIISNTSPSINVVNNNYYNKSYSRYINNEISSKYRSPLSTNSSVVYEANHKHLGGSLKSISKGSGISTHSAKTVQSFNTNASSPQNSSIVFLSCTNDVNSPWSKFKRDQQRVTIIRNKIDAAVKIQRFYRKYFKKVQVLNHNKLQIKKFPISEQVVESTNSANVNAETVVCTNLIQDSSYNDDLYEVAALVIQLTWREYLKKKLMGSISRYEESNDTSFNDFQSSTKESEVFENTSELKSEYSKTQLDEINVLKKPLNNVSVKRKRLLASFAHQQESPYAVSLSSQMKNISSVKGNPKSVVQRSKSTQ